MITRTDLSKIHPLYKRSFSGILRQRWCPFASSVGRCDNKCLENSFCSSHLKEILSGDFGGSRRPEGVLIHRFRTERARAMEELSRSEKEQIERDPLGEVVSGNAFERLGVMIGD